jgi:hypothetical protein
VGGCLPVVLPGVLPSVLPSEMALGMQEKRRRPWQEQVGYHKFLKDENPVFLGTATWSLAM